LPFLLTGKTLPGGFYSGETRETRFGGKEAAILHGNLPGKGLLSESSWKGHQRFFTLPLRGGKNGEAYNKKKTDLLKKTISFSRRKEMGPMASRKKRDGFFSLREEFSRRRRYP